MIVLPGIIVPVAAVVIGVAGVLGYHVTGSAGQDAAAIPPESPSGQVTPDVLVDAPAS